MAQIYLDQIAEAKDLLTKALKKLDDSQLAFENDEIDKAISLVLDYEVLSEKIVNQARLLPNYSGQDFKRQIEENIISEQDIKIEYIENNWLYLKIPFLLPKKEKGSASYIRATIQSAFRNYLGNHTIKRITEDSIIIFQHIYDKNFPDKIFRDHDNIEINVVVDSIALFALLDDSPFLLKHYYTSKKGDSNYTNVFVIPCMDFKYWLDSYQDEH